MEENKIRAYAALMQELGLTKLAFREGDQSVCLERGGAQVPILPTAPVEQGREIHSPMVGVFYRAPAENAPAYVEVGAAVKKGDVLCLIESMKLMNELTAEQDGIIAEICVQNGQVVDYGCPLFRLKEVPS